MHNFKQSAALVVISEQIQSVVVNYQGSSCTLKLQVNVCPVGDIMSNAWTFISRPMGSIMCGPIVSTPHSSLTLQKAPEFPVWTTCQKPVEYIKFRINFSIMESEKTFSSQTILEFGIPIVGNFMY